MGSLFGSEQTVPQTQFTNQTANQTANQTGVQSYQANPYAQGMAKNVSEWSDYILGRNPNSPPPNVPGLQVAPLTDAQWGGLGNLYNQSIGQGNALINAGMGGVGQGAYDLNSAAGYFPTGANYLQGAGGFFPQAGYLVNAGAGTMVGAASPITAGDISSFYNPMAGNITANLQDIFNQQNLAARVGGTSATGGVGGDRAAVAQALLAKQQGLAAGQTYAGLYQSALQAAQQQKAQQLQAGQGLVGAGAQYGGLGSQYGALGNAYGGLGSQLGALGAQQAGWGVGTTQAGLGALGQGLQAASIPQAQQQAVNQALYQQLLGLYQDPFMRLSATIGGLPAVAGIGGTGATSATGTQVSNQGQTGQSQTTYPAPPFVSQIAGLGSLALGAGALFGGSDKRAKTDIQPYGKDKATGLKMYAYRYKGDPKTYPKVVGPMAQDIEKKYPGTTTKFARGGGIQRFQYGGGDDSGQQQQDTNYLTGFTDYAPVAGSEGSDAPTPPYAEQQSTWDLKRIFSPDRLQKAQRAIMLGQRAAAQSQVARPRVSPITFPQMPGMKSNWGGYAASGGRIYPRFANGGRLAINLPALSRAMTQQEGGRVDAATADSWGGYKVWRPGMRNYARDYDWGEGVTENAPPQGRPFTAQPQTQDQWGPGQNENQARNRLLWDRMLETREPWRGARGRNVNPNARVEGVYRLGGKVRGYDDGGFVDPLAGMDPMPESEPEPPGLPEYEDMPDTGDEALPAIPVPRPRPPGAGQGIPFMPGAGPAAPAGGGGPSLFGKPVSPGAMALIQAGLGMLAASGQRDARGLPMSGLAAIGKGGAAGLETYQSMQNQQQKDLLAQQGMRLREQTLAQNLTRQNADLALRQQAQADLERHRANLLAQRSGEDRPFTVKGPYGDRTVIKKADGTYEEIKPSKPQPGVIEPPEEKTAGAAAFDPSGGLTPPVTDDEKDTAARVMTEGGFKSPLKVDPDLLDAMQTSPEQFDFNAARLALGDTSVLQGYGNRQAAVAYRNALKSRAAQYWLDRGLTANDANAAVAEFGAMKAGARSLGNQEARITGALEKAASVAPVVKDLSKQVSRTNYPALNKIIVAAKEQTGDPTVIKYGIAIETLITEYGSALGQGNTVLSDHQSKRAENILKKAYSEGQMDAAVDQLLVEIDRVKAGVRKGMGTYLGKRESSPFAPALGSSNTAGPQKGARKQFKQGWGVWDGTQWVPERP